MHELSGDIHLTWPQRIWYLPYNFCRGVAGLFARVPRKRFIPRELPRSSDSFLRQYVDAFLREELPRHCPVGTIDILDIGCGTGYVRDILARAGYGGTYHGIDVVKEPAFDSNDNQAFVSTLELVPIEDARFSMTYDLVISNTSFEHIPDDMEAAQQAHRACKHGGVEVHVMPAFWSLFVYLWHGYRQYTPRRIKRVFAGSNYTLYPLGGCASFVCQFLFGTIPERLTGTILFRKQSWYPACAQTCIKIDRFLPFCSMGYAIVVTHEK